MFLSPRICEIIAPHIFTPSTNIVSSASHAINVRYRIEILLKQARSPSPRKFIVVGCYGLRNPFLPTSSFHITTNIIVSAYAINVSIGLKVLSKRSRLPYLRKFEIPIPERTASGNILRGSELGLLPPPPLRPLPTAKVFNSCVNQGNMDIKFLQIVWLPLAVDITAMDKKAFIRALENIVVPTVYR